VSGATTGIAASAFGDTLRQSAFGDCRLMLRFLPVVLGTLTCWIMSWVVTPALAQNAPRGSECLAMATRPPLAVPVSLRRTAAKADEVSITYAGHSTYYIDTPGGVTIATDYNGIYKLDRIPDVVTMNRAHSTHYTLYPDPRIKTVLHGWGESGQPADPQRHDGHPPLLWR
jgi:hypothetical protein